MKLRWIYLVLAAGVAAGCSQSAVDAPAGASQTDLQGVVERYVDEYRPEWKGELSLPAVVTDLGSRWEYTFKLPEGTGGEVPVFMIDKTTLTVVEARLAS